VISTAELKALSSLAGVTQDDLAVTMGCKRQMISKVINKPSKYPHKAEKLKALLDELCLPLGQVIVHPEAA
jgi:transcriptional regulator with XRE-family HTH domain